MLAATVTIKVLQGSGVKSIVMKPGKIFLWGNMMQAIPGAMRCTREEGCCAETAGIAERRSRNCGHSGALCGCINLSSARIVG
jgi:hypothetical protein